MTDQIIDAGAAHGLHAYAERTFSNVGWVVMRDLPAHSGKIVARLVTENPTPYVLVADTLAEIHDKLPLGLERSGRQSSDPPEVVELWFATAATRTDGRRTTSVDA